MLFLFSHKKKFLDCDELNKVVSIHYYGSLIMDSSFESTKKVLE